MPTALRWWPLDAGTLSGCEAAAILVLVIGMLSFFCLASCKSDLFLFIASMIFASLSRLEKDGQQRRVEAWRIYEYIFFLRQKEINCLSSSQHNHRARRQSVFYNSSEWLERASLQKYLQKEEE